MRSPFKFAQHGKSGMWISDLMPHLAEQADKICVIRSMFTVHPNHEPALFVIHTGRILPGRPSMGSWVVFGLGSENQNLPAYVVLDDPLGLPINGPQNWQAGFLPPVYQGTRIRSVGSPILNLRPEYQQPSEFVELSHDLLSRLDNIHKRNHPGQMELDARISSYELAARLQLSASDALDVMKEDEATRAMYGVGDGADRFVRPALPDGAAPGRARRALRAALHQQPDLGQPHQPRRRHARRQRAHR